MYIWYCERDGKFDPFSFFSLFRVIFFIIIIIIISSSLPRRIYIIPTRNLKT